jgi:N-acetyl-anhydromuramyl-L-alanine amidase AmpD
VAPALDDGYWQPVAYSGGVKPESLEFTHLRGAEPDLIVYHHTAMSSKVPFQGVVDEFLVNKGWQTGYHCVVMPDGAIKPFCRWDRTGNHAQGLNHRSLGLAFHGNFHTLNNDRYSNFDGRFGFQKPTTAQLDAGARVVALWVHLYSTIDLDFASDILPHKTAMPGHTVCPGSNFPHEEFQEKVRFYHERWTRSAVAQQQIALFKQNPYVYATQGGRS